LANSFPIEILTANETMATLKALLATSLNLDAGGNNGAGMLHTSNYQTQHTYTNWPVFTSAARHTATAQYMLDQTEIFSLCI